MYGDVRFPSVLTIFALLLSSRLAVDFCGSIENCEKRRETLKRIYGRNFESRMSFQLLVSEGSLPRSFAYILRVVSSRAQNRRVPEPQRGFATKLPPPASTLTQLTSSPPGQQSCFPPSKFA